MFQRSGVKDDVDPRHASEELVAIAHIRNKKARAGVVYVGLVQEKELALVVVDADDFAGGVPRIREQLSDEFGADRSAGAGDEDPLVRELGHGDRFSIRLALRKNSAVACNPRSKS